MSFSNFNSSASGPLMVAFLLGLAVLGGFVVLGTLTLDPRYWGKENVAGEIESNMDRIQALKTEETQLKERLKGYDSLNAKLTEFDKLNSNVLQQRNRSTSLATTVIEAKQSIFETEQNHFEHIQKYRAKVRSEAKGKKMDTLTTTDGEVYKDVTITKVDAIGIGIDHESGGRRIPYKKLPLDMQDFYQFGENEAQELAQREVERQKQSNLAHEAATKSASDRQKMLESMKSVQDTSDRQSTLAKIQLELAALESQISQTKQEIESQRYEKVSQAPKFRLHLEKLEDMKLKLNAQIQQLSISQ